MRYARLLGVLSLLVVPTMAAAQEKNPFIDSWFWGAKGGMLVMRTEIAQTKAPVFGAEWLITRRNYALYLGLDQAYFDAVSTVDDAPSRGIVRRVDIRDLRRLTAAMYLYPKTIGEALRPYVGLGYAFNFVVRAASQGDQFANPASRDTVLQRIEDAKTRGTFVGTLGAQYHILRWAPFAQISVAPTRGAGDFLINGKSFTYYLEAGVRYNFGTSIERIH